MILRYSYFAMLRVVENTAVSMELSESEQTFIDSVCKEMGIKTRTEFLQIALVRLQELKTQWPDSFRLLLST